MSDPFELLGVPARFAFDAGALEARHREVSKALHPDRYASAPGSERRAALSRAIEVNAALRVLKDPVKRAEALLARAGARTGEEAETKAPAGLLMEMMELREALAAASAKKDGEALAGLVAEVEGRERATLEGLARALDGAPGPDVSSALPLLGELRYLRRFLEEASALEEELAS